MCARLPYGREQQRTENILATSFHVNCGREQQRTKKVLAKIFYWTCGREQQRTEKVLAKNCGRESQERLGTKVRQRTEKVLAKNCGGSRAYSRVKSSCMLSSITVLLSLLSFSTVPAGASNAGSLLCQMRSVARVLRSRTSKNGWLPSGEAPSPARQALLG